MRHLTIAFLVVLALSACDTKVPTPVRVKQPAPSPTFVEGAPEPKGESQARGERYIPVAEAVRKLKKHIDLPIVLPGDALAGLRNLSGWRAAPKYLEWGTQSGERFGSMTLHKGRKVLILSYGRAGFDGCGGRDHAIETDVLGQPALVTQTREHVWSDIIWPVTDNGSSGRYGLSGSFEAWAIVRLAESMEAKRLEAQEIHAGC